MKVVIWVVAIFVALYLLARTSGFMQQPLVLDTGNENTRKFSKILQSCGNEPIPFRDCKSAFTGLPWQMSSIFGDSVAAQMCNPDGSINKKKFQKYISCPR